MFHDEVVQLSHVFHDEIGMLIDNSGAEYIFAD